MIPKARELLEKILLNDIVNIIITYLGNECDKCKEITTKSLIIGLSFQNGTYDFKDIKGSKYVLKKFCDKCIYCRCSPVPIYVEIHNEKLVYPNY